ncbi:hypothetical protein [Anaeromyxobacter oryzae]|nr:hypothetical protein [Anaeromyxobacter oryzae]
MPNAPAAPTPPASAGPLIIEVPAAAKGEAATSAGPATNATPTPSEAGTNSGTGPTGHGTEQPGSFTGTTQAPTATATPSATAPRLASLQSAPLRVSVVRTVDPDGRVVLTLIGPDGERIGRPVVRHVMDLPVLSSRRDSWGRVVRVVTDGSGAPIEVLLDPMGRFLSARALDGPTASR